MFIWALISSNAYLLYTVEGFKYNFLCSGLAKPCSHRAQNILVRTSAKLTWLAFQKINVEALGQVRFKGDSVKLLEGLITVGYRDSILIAQLKPKDSASQ